MKFFEILEKFKRNYSSLILYCLLNRIPIIVYGNDSDKIDDFLIDLSELIHFRDEYIFYTDFISKIEYQNLICNENIDYNIQRAHIRCPCNVALKALRQFDKFESWLIGIVIPNRKEDFFSIKNQLKKKIKEALYIYLSSNKFSVIFETNNPKTVNFSLEENIFKKISQDTENSIIKMKRVLKDKTKLNNLDKELIKTLVDFEIEKIELKKNIFKREVQNFYSGSKRAFFILSRLNLLNNIEIHAKIGSKTLLETIDYDDAPIERIISFILKEWGENFSELIEDGKRTFIGDKIVSLWG
ncbi:MAG: hypothetical protein ACFFHD_07185 [Promethearchaeota archaeon]